VLKDSDSCSSALQLGTNLPAAIGEAQHSGDRARVNCVDGVSQRRGSLNGLVFGFAPGLNNKKRSVSDLKTRDLKQIDARRAQ
jgi:hypothetical protein